VYFAGGLPFAEQFHIADNILSEIKSDNEKIIEFVSLIRDTILNKEKIKNKYIVEQRA
jgi:hypothetical protein